MPALMAARVHAAPAAPALTTSVRGPPRDIQRGRSAVRARPGAVGARPARGARAVRRAGVNWDAFRPVNDYRGPAQPGSTFSNGVPAVRRYDFVVVGSGIAGLTYALKVAQHGSVAVITKDYANEGCTQYAQGGVCAVLDAADSFDNHVRDTMVAGGFLNDAKWVPALHMRRQGALPGQRLGRAAAARRATGWPISARGPAAAPSGRGHARGRPAHPGRRSVPTPAHHPHAVAGLWRWCAARDRPACWSWRSWARSSRAILMARCTSPAKADTGGWGPGACPAACSRQPLRPTTRRRTKLAVPPGCQAAWQVCWVLAAGPGRPRQQWPPAGDPGVLGPRRQGCSPAERRCARSWGCGS
jgi:hypothetical protein